MSPFEKPPGSPNVRRFENERELREAIENDPIFRNQLRVWLEQAENRTPSPTQRVHKEQVAEANAAKD